MPLLAAAPPTGAARWRRVLSVAALVGLAMLHVGFITLEGGRLVPDLATGIVVPSQALALALAWPVVMEHGLGRSSVSTTSLAVLAACVGALAAGVALHEPPPERVRGLPIALWIGPPAVVLLAALALGPGTLAPAPGERSGLRCALRALPLGVLGGLAGAGALVAFATHGGRYVDSLLTAIVLALLILLAVSVPVYVALREHVAGRAPLASWGVAGGAAALCVLTLLLGLGVQAAWTQLIGTRDLFFVAVPCLSVWLACLILLPALRHAPRAASIEEIADAFD